jgi:hypothetical protein
VTEGLRRTQDLLHRTGPEQSCRPLGRQAPGERSNDADGLYAGFAIAPLISGPASTLHIWSCSIAR